MGDPSLRSRFQARYDWRNFVVYIGFFAILAFFSIVLRGTGFVTFGNFMSILRQSAPILVMAVAMTFVLAGGQIDLSIGSTVALSALVAALILRETSSVFLTVGGAIGVGLIVGALNGGIVVVFDIPPFLVTLGMLSIVMGVARTITSLDSIPVVDESFLFWFGSGYFGPVSILVLWSIGAIVLAHFALRHTRYGLRTLSTGGNATAARQIGISVSTVRFTTLLVASLSASLAGLLYAGRLHGARYTLGGEQDLLTVLAAVVIGGTSLFGGRASVMGSVAGALIMGMLNNGLVIMGLSVSQQMIVRGGVIIVAVMLSLRGRS